jgi:Flp pilus assembly protein TadD
VEINLLDLAADHRGHGPPRALGRRFPEMVVRLLRAAGVSARRGSVTVPVDSPAPGALGWAVFAGGLVDGDAVALSNRLGPARLLAFGELGPEGRQGMTLRMRVLGRDDGRCALTIARRFFLEEVPDAALAVARSLAELVGRGQEVAALDVSAVLGTARSAALLCLHHGLDVLEGLESGLAGCAPEQAVELLVQALEEDPACTSARQHALAAIARHAGGLLSLERVVELGNRLAAVSPGDPQPVLELGELLAGRPGCLEAARRVLETALGSLPPDARVLSLLAGVLVESGEHEAAVERYSAAARLRPDDPALLSNLGLVLSHVGRVAEAEPLARRAVELDPHDVIARKVLEHVRQKN